MYNSRHEIIKYDHKEWFDDWMEMSYRLMSVSVPPEKVGDIFKYVSEIVESGEDVLEEAVPDHISKLFNDKFTFEVLVEVVDHTHDLISCYFGNFFLEKPGDDDLFW